MLVEMLQHDLEVAGVGPIQEVKQIPCQRYCTDQGIHPNIARHPPQLPARHAQIACFPHQIEAERGGNRVSGNWDQPKQRIQPMVATPGHSSYPAGHATQGEMLKLVLASLLGLSSTSETYGQLDRLAARIAENRVVAGLHYPVDNEQGRILGAWLAWYFLDCATVADTPLAWLWKLASAER